MDGDLLGDMAFAAPSTGGGSQSQPMDSQPSPAIDLLSGSPIKTKERVQSGSSIDSLNKGQESGGDGDNPSQVVSHLPFSDKPIEFQANKVAAPQEKQNATGNDLLGLPATSAEPESPDMSARAKAKPFSDEPQMASDPFAPPTQQTTCEDALFDPFSDQPTAPQTGPFATPATNSAVENIFDPFSDQPSQLAAPDLFAAPLEREESPVETTKTTVDLFAPTEQPESAPLDAQASDLLGDLTPKSEETITPNDAVGVSDDGKASPESEGVEAGVEANGTTKTKMTNHTNDEKDEHSELDDSNMAPESVQSPLEASSDTRTSIEEADDAEKEEQVEVPPIEKEVPPKVDAIPSIPEIDPKPSPDPPESSTPRNATGKVESTSDSKESSSGESRTKPSAPNKPQNGGGSKSDKTKSEDGNAAAPAKAQIQGKVSQPKPNDTSTRLTVVQATQQTPKAKEPVKAISARKMGVGNQKLDFGMASNMFRSFSSKSGAQLKQLQSKGGASLKVGLSRLGEASSNLADTIKQKNAASNVFKAEEFPRPERTQPNESQPTAKPEPAASKNSGDEMFSGAVSAVDSGTKATVSEEKKDEGNAVEIQQSNGTKARGPHATNEQVTTSVIAAVNQDEQTAVVPNASAEPIKAKAIGQKKEPVESESKGKDVKQALTAASVTSLFGLKIEKLPTATVDKSKAKNGEKKKIVPQKVQKEGDVDTCSPESSEKQGDKGAHIAETEEETAKEGAPQESPFSGAMKPKADEAAFRNLEEKEGMAAKALEAKPTTAAESTEKNKEEQVEKRISPEAETSENDENLKAIVAQGAGTPDQTAKLSERIAALEKELRNSKEASLKQIQSLQKEFQISKDGAMKQIQALQKELQASKDGSSRLIKSLEKKLHASQETAKQLKEKSMKLQQGAEENELKKDLIEDLNSRLQNEMGKRQESESTGKKTKEKLDKVVEQFNALQKTSKERLLQMKGAIDKLMQSNKKMEEEIVAIRAERDEQGQRLSSYTTELNEAKKNSATKVNAYEHYELKMNELDTQLRKTRDQMAQIKFERDRSKKELGNWKKYAEDRNKQLEGQLNHEKKLNEERKRRMKFFVEAKTEEARSSNVDNVSLQAELDQTTRSLKDFNQRYKQLHNQWVQAQTRNRELQRDMAKMKNDSEKMSKVGGTLEAKLSRYSKEIEDHKTKRLAAKNELMTVIAKLEEEKKASAQLRDFVKNTMTPKVLLQHQVLQDSADHLDGGVRQLALRFGREFASLRRKRNGQPDPLADSKPKTLEEIQSMVGDSNTARVLSKLEEESHRVNEQIFTISTSVEQLDSLLVAPTTKGCVGAMFNF